MSTKLSIYSRCNPQLTKLYDEARHPAKVLCAAMDYAKASHSVLLCNGMGDVLRSKFVVENTAEGVAELLRVVRACAKQRRIDLRHAFFGGEDMPSYAENFLRRLRQEHFLVVRVNALQAKQQREKLDASTDALDLLGIARCCVNRKANLLDDLPCEYWNLRIATRNRDTLVRTRTGVANRMHTYVDRLLPGFLSQSRSGLVPFSQASLDLMREEAFGAAELRRRPKASLTRWLARRGVEDPESTSIKLKKLAATVLESDPIPRPMLQSSLAQLAALHVHLQGSIAKLDREIAYWLCRTDGAWLTSIPGVGITLAAGWTAELGPSAQWRGADRTCAYAGLVPRIKQSGGPDKQARVGHVQQGGNKRLKNVLLQAVELFLRFGPEEVRQSAAEMETRGSHVRYRVAKKLVRIGKYLELKSCVYLPRSLIQEGTPKEILSAEYKLTWKKLVEKWKDKAKLTEVFCSQHPLGKWRDMARQLYALELKLPNQKAAGRTGAAQT